MTSHYNINTILNSFSEVLFLSIYVDSDDDRLKDWYSHAVDEHNSAILRACDTDVYDRHVNSGFDLPVPVLPIFNPRMVNRIDFRVQCSAVRYVLQGQEVISRNSGFYMYPRSSLSRTDLRMANSVGIIDSGYRGNIQGMFDYVGDRIYVDKAVEQYDRIVQLCSPTLGPVYVELVPSNILERTERGVGGIGSTGF